MRVIRHPRPGRLEYSDETHLPVYAKDLAWAKRKTLRVAAQNYLFPSSYGFTWNSTATDAGLISIGEYADVARIRLAMDSTASYTGVQTWDGDGDINSAEVPTSGWTRACFSCAIGSYHMETNPSYSVSLAILDQVGTLLGTVTYPARLSGFRPYLSVALPDGTTGVFCVISVASGGKWYVENFQLERDATSPGNFVPTTTAAVIHATDKATWYIAKIEDEEDERAVEDWEFRGIPRGDPNYTPVTRSKY